ncbi:uncharacterized protein LOC109846164 [Asparagus officinalis]|uniref:uncharacterized protein LOC109846164 n=1 Tax=Asparagus officinalis TaxID=4686 RepID=UPI00098E4FF8|nr:uncharacterized protein LOC109846164 [Asparagus officinalis]
MVSEPIAFDATSEIPLSSSSLPIVKAIRQEVSIKLLSTNYLPWRTQVLPVLSSHGLIGLVDGTLPRPDGDDESSEVAQWIRLDQLVLAWLTNILSKSSVNQVGTCATSAEAKSLAQILASADKPVDEDDLISWILLGLRSEFDLIVATVNISREPLPVDEVIVLLLDFELCIKSTKITTDPLVAMFTTRGRGRTNSGGRSAHGNAGRRSFSSGNWDRGSFSPSGHGSVSHLQPMLMHGGHHGPSRGMSRGGRGSSRPNASTVGDSSRVYCFRCGHPYHKANNCFAPDSIVADTTQAFTAMHLADQMIMHGTQTRVP